MTRVNSLLELTYIRNRWKKKLEICTCEIFNSEIFSKNFNLKALLTVRVRVPIKNSKTKFYNSSNLGLIQRLPKWRFSESSTSSGLDQTFPKLDVRNSSSSGLKQRLPRWDFSENSSSKLNQTLPNLRFSNSSNSGLGQRIPKWNFIESSSLRFDLLLPMSGFGYSLNSGLGQKHPKWNFTESSAWGSTKYFQSKTLSKKKLYLSSSGLKSNTSQVRFGCDSNSGAVLALILTSVNLFFLFSFSSF